jgi:hypothetical protein
MSIGNSSLRTIGITLEKKHLLNLKEDTGIKPQTLSLPDNFDNNVKQVIYDLGKYMR